MDYREDVKIFEDSYENYDKAKFIEMRDNLMSKEEIKRTDFYIREYETRKSEQEENREEWLDIHKMYKGERDSEYESDPNSFVNIILPQIEGQVSSMTHKKITASCRGKGYSDQHFAKTADILSRVIMKENKMSHQVKKTSRRYCLLGNTVASVSWNKDALDGFGLPQIDTPSLTKVFFDGKIKNIDEIQRSEYIIEEIPMSILWVEREYGEEIKRAIQYGNLDPDFQAKDIDDDDKSFTMLRVWTRNNENENLQMILMSYCGILLEESDPAKPYYKYVNNKYPIMAKGLYNVEGEVYCFGDGKILMPIQRLINELYDEIVLAIRFSSQGRTYVDPNAKLSTRDFAEADPRKPLYVRNPQQNIKTETGAGINQVVFHLLEQLFAKVQEITRFSHLMTGNRPGAGDMTATQASIQMQQGNTGIEDKKADISAMFAEALIYALELCMEKWSAAKALRIVEDEDEFDWVDARKLAQIPEMIPASSEYLRSWGDKNPSAKEKPKYMQLKTSDGKYATKKLELDMEVSLGEGLPDDKASLYNIVIGLAQLTVIDEQTMQPRPLLSYQQVRDMIEEYLGMKLPSTDEKPNIDPMMLQLMMQQQQGQPGSPSMTSGGSFPGQALGTGLAKGGSGHAYKQSI